MREVYDECFADAGYSRNANQFQLDFALACMGYWKPKTLVDVGAGRGHFLRRASEVLDYEDMTAIDIGHYHNTPCQTQIISTLEEPLDPPEEKWDMAVCLDVVEHLQMKHIRTAMENLRQMSDHVVIAAANHSDIHHGVELHLIQEEQYWWRSLINDFFTIATTSVGPRIYCFQCIAR